MTLDTGLRERTESEVPFNIGNLTKGVSREVMDRAVAILPQMADKSYLLEAEKTARFREFSNGHGAQTECSVVYQGVGTFRYTARGTGPEAQAEALVQNAINRYLYGDYNGAHAV